MINHLFHLPSGSGLLVLNRRLQCFDCNSDLFSVFCWYFGLSSVCFFFFLPNSCPSPALMAVMYVVNKQSKKNVIDCILENSFKQCFDQDNEH